MKKSICSLVFILTVISISYSQVPFPVFEDKIPSPVFERDLSTSVKNATVVVKYKYEQNKYSVGSGSVVIPQRKDGRWYVLTANHCTSKIDSPIEIVLADKTSIKGKVVAKDSHHDIAWIITEDNDLKLKGADLGDSLPKQNQKVCFFGYGGKTFRKGKVNNQYLISEDNLVWYDFPAISGDSGCGIFCESSKKIIGILSCGTKQHTAAGNVVAARNLKFLLEKKLKDE